MIKLIRPAKPEKLAEKEKELTQKFKNDKSSVWRKPYIISALSLMSYNKCCFCETNLGEQAKNLQVEHFHYKDEYPDEVVAWENLLPSCSQCNSNKGTHDTYKEPIVNPTVDNPKDFFTLKFYRITSKDRDINSKGRRTIELLDLNNRERLVNPRIKIADTMQDKLRGILDKAIEISSGENTRQLTKTRVKNGIRDILKMAQPEAEYSAFMSTILLEDDDYLEIKEIMKAEGLWNEELEKLNTEAEKIKFDTVKKKNVL